MVETMTDNSVQAQLWYTSSDAKSLDFIKNLANYVEPILKDKLFFAP
jgi:hypothetical protein